MKYKILKEFLPIVIVDQECEVEKDGNLRVWFSNEICDEILAISESYAKQHQEIFQPIEELKENETEFEDVHESTWIREIGICKECRNTVEIGNFCSNCGRKRKI